MTKIILSLIAICSFCSIQAQTYTLSGYIKDKESRENLIGANLYEEKNQKGTNTNDYGFYSLSLPKGEVELVVSYIGYQADTLVISLTENQQLDINLSPTVALSTVEVKARRGTNDDRLGTIRLSAKELKGIPSLGGEADILKAIQLLPGVKFGDEGTSGFYVRGGGPDQNLILLDGIPVYNPSHLFGFISTFNPDAISNIDLIKGGFPARYGGRLSSVLDIRLKDGNKKELKGQGNLGIVASKLLLEGPISKGKGSFLVSGRRSLYELALLPAALINNQGERNNFSFYDLNAKLNYQLSDKDRLFATIYAGNDKLKFKSQYSGSYGEETAEEYVNWGNRIASLRWNHQFNSKLFSNINLFYNRYRFNTGADYNFYVLNENQEPVLDKYLFDYISNVDDVGVKMDFFYTPVPAHNIKFGTATTQHRFKPGVLSGVSDSLATNAPSIDALESRIYVEDNILLTDWWQLNLGLHASLFNVRGEQYTSIEPRLNTRFFLGKKWTFDASYAQMQQYLHLLTNSSLGLPTDLWVPPTDNVPPQQSSQVAAGLSFQPNKKYNFSIETYYKQMKGLVNYKEGASFLIEGKDWEDKVAIDGIGESYGIELFAQKRAGNTTGWLAYTLSYTDRQFDEINFGRAFPYKYDRRHDIALVLTHKFSERIRLNLNWVFATGNAVTLPRTIYPNINFPPNVNEFRNTSERNLISLTSPVSFVRQLEEIVNYGETNSSRMPSYHRLDIGVSFFKKTKWGEQTLDFSVYNAYNNRNPYYIRYVFEGQFSDDTDTTSGKFQAVSLIPLIPSISYGFKF